MPPQIEAQGQAQNDLAQALVVTLRDVRIRSVVARHFLSIFAVTSFFSFFALFLKRQLGLGPRDASWLLAGAGGVGGLALVFVVGRATRVYGDERVAQAGFALLLCAFGALAFTRNVWVFCVVLAVWATGSACIEPTLTALLSRVSPPAERGAIMGLNDAASNIALILAPLVGGVVFDVDPRLVSVVPGIAVLIAFVAGAVPTRRASSAARAPRRR